MSDSNAKIKLFGFNNLTKTLSFNFYDICYANTAKDRDEYLAYIDETYSAERLTTVLSEVAEIIGANILNVASQSYEPRGASVSLLIAEESFEQKQPSSAVLAHLDKSHITAHTYPESHPDGGITTFRADIDVSTCGEISPLSALNYLVDAFDEDIVVLDYRVRGFTRDVHGRKLYKDHPITSIQDYLKDKTKRQYQMIDVNVYQENIFHTKMMLKNFDLDNYLFGRGVDGLDPSQLKEIEQRVRTEMAEIYYGMETSS